eukprot:3669132-Prymnesium_polylepis.1
MSGGGASEDRHLQDHSGGASGVSELRGVHQVPQQDWIAVLRGGERRHGGVARSDCQRRSGVARVRQAE